MSDPSHRSNRSDTSERFETSGAPSAPAGGAASAAGVAGAGGAGSARAPRLAWLDGELVPFDSLRVHLLSHSLARGSLVFDYMVVSHVEGRGPAVFRLGEHVARFVNSCALVGLPLAQDAAALERACIEAVRVNPDATVVKLNAYLPSLEVDVVPADDRVSVAALAYHPEQDILAHKNPPPAPAPAKLKLWVEKERRQRRPDIMHPHAKVSANYTSSVRAKWHAQRQGFDEILLLDEAGNLAESPTANLFLVDAGGALNTPPVEAVLPGVTRRSILALAEAEGLPVREGALHPRQLYAASEAFLTGSGAGVWPIAEVDRRTIGAACPGPVTQRLSRRLLEVKAGKDPEFLHWLHFVDVSP